MQDDQVKWKIELGLLPTMTKYAGRGPNLATSFLRCEEVCPSENERSGNKAHFGVKSGSAKLGGRAVVEKDANNT